MASVNTPPLLPTGTPPLVTERSASPLRSRSRWQNKLLITGCVLLGVSGLSAGSAALWYHHNFNASSFRPVMLTAAEQEAMDDKVLTIEGQKKAAYDASKTIVLNEREINGYLESQGLGETVKVNINNGRVAATILAPVDPDVPLLGGNTVRLKVAFNSQIGPDHKLALSLADVSVGGISLPNAWLGGMKSLNLLSDSRGDGRMSNDFLDGMVAGIKDFQMKDGEIKVVLND